MGLVFLLILVVLSVLSGVLPRNLRSRGLIAFYFGVLPLGVGLLFLVVQCSPSPAHGVGQIVECLLAVSVLSLCVSLPVSLLVMSPSVRRSLIDGRGLWFTLGAIACVCLVTGLMGFFGDPPFAGSELNELVVGIVLILITLAGIKFRWGPIVPCVFLGIVSSTLFMIIFVGSSDVAYEADVAYRRAIQVAIKTFVVGAVCGAVVGLVLERKSHRGRSVHDHAVTTDAEGH